VNLSDQPVQVKPGDRIAQLIVAPVTRVQWEEVAELEATDRKGGFGHTGVEKG